MTLKEYLQNLEAFVKEYPEALSKTVVASADDEGNAFNPVHFAPCLGKHDGYEFDAFDPNGGEDGLTLKDCNAVCIN